MTEFWDWVGRISSFVGLAGALFAALAWLKTRALVAAEREAKARREAPIRLVLVTQKPDGGGASVALPYRPRRDQLSRGELLGVLGMYGGKDRFDPTKAVLSVIESGEFARVLGGDDQSARDETLHIRCSPAEFDLFTKVVEERQVGRPLA